MITNSHLGIAIDMIDLTNHISLVGNEMNFWAAMSTKFILLINVKIPTIVGILTFISMINTTLEGLINQRTSLFVDILVFMSS